MTGLLVFVVFLAGCAQQATTTGGTGVIIKSFAPDLTDASGGSTVTFIVNAKNTGDATADNVKALLFGLSNEWTTMPTAVSSVGGGKLAPADLATGLPGEEGSVDWSLTAPAGKASDVTYDASVRLFYTYPTTSDIIIRFVTDDYARTTPTAQKGILTSGTTAGPLTITAVARTPVLSTGSTKGRIQLEIQNIGSGRVFKGASIPSNGVILAADLDILKAVTITGVGALGSCAVGAAGNSQTPANVRLAGGKSKVISCDVDASGIVNFKDIALKITVDYNYFVDSASQVTVSKALQ